MMDVKGRKGVRGNEKENLEQIFHFRFEICLFKKAFKGKFLFFMNEIILIGTKLNLRTNFNQKIIDAAF